MKERSLISMLLEDRPSVLVQSSSRVVPGRKGFNK